jgi:hypothetical protein
VLNQAVTKKAVMLDDGLSPLLALVQNEDPDNIRNAIYALGSLSENDEVMMMMMMMRMMILTMVQPCEGLFDGGNHDHEGTEHDGDGCRSRRGWWSWVR